ncbi:MAG: DNA primase [Crocinitomicaceae bacterium]|jgi:DNA primase
MAIIPPHIVDDIMQTSRIEEVIGDFVELKRAGANFKGSSPFTDKKTNSFVVSPAKQIFKCFSSGKGGSVVTFLMEQGQYTYPEALRWLADRYNVIIPEEEATKPAVRESKAVPPKKQLVVINDGIHTEYYPEGKKVKLKGFVDDDNKRQGVWDYFAENGVQLSMMEYRDGLKQGVFFQRYKTGVIRRTGNYKQDQQVGEWVQYDENGIRVEIKQFSH